MPKRQSITPAERAERKAQGAQFEALNTTHCPRCGIVRVARSYYSQSLETYVAFAACKCGDIDVYRKLKHQAIAVALYAHRVVTRKGE